MRMIVAGEEYDITASSVATTYFFHCHTHANIAGETHVHSN